MLIMAGTGEEFTQPVDWVYFVRKPVHSKKLKFQTRSALRAMKVVLAEKPSVAREIASFLGAGSRR